MSNDKRIYLIGLTLIKGVGCILARHLLQYFEDAEAVFTEKKQSLEKVPGIGEYTAARIIGSRDEALSIAEKELSFIEKNKIRLYTLLDTDYPNRLRECPDAPVSFYYKGNADLNASHILSIVGTRHASEYGLELTSSLIKDLAKSHPDILIISGLAYGIDICAHRNALKNGLSTVGVIAHGLDRIYPAIHRNTAAEMLKNGGLLTDFISNTNPDRENFLQRNRLIAGLADATIVVESAKKGGALVTANIACSYSRDVYAFPGRVNDERSIGCNQLIQSNKAGLITSAHDLIMALCWDTHLKEKQTKENDLFSHEKPDHPVLALLSIQGETHINDIALTMNMPVHQLAGILFELEMLGQVKALPGAMYKRLNY